MKRKIIICSILLLVVILAVLVIAEMRLSKNIKQDIEYTDDIESLMIPTGSFNFIKNYKGDNKNTVLYNGIYKFSKYLPKWQEDLKGKLEGKIIGYYREHNEEIRACSGIETEQKFVELINYVEKFDVFQNPKSADIDDDSFVNSTYCLTFTLVLTYENGELPVVCNYDNVYRDGNNAFEFLPVKE